MAEIVKFGGIKRRRVLEIVTKYGGQVRPKKLSPAEMLQRCKIDAQTVKKIILRRAV